MNNTHKTDQYHFEVQGEGVDWIKEFKHNIKSCTEGAKKLGLKIIAVGSINCLYQEGAVSK